MAKCRREERIQSVIGRMHPLDSVQQWENGDPAVLPDDSLYEKAICVVYFLPHVHVMSHFSDMHSMM